MDFINLVYVDDALFGSFDVKIGILKKAKDNILDVFADISRFRQCGGIDDSKGDVEELSERTGDECFAGACGAKEQNIGLIILKLFIFLLVVHHPLIVVIDGDGNYSLGSLLPDDILIEFRFNLFRFEVGDHQGN